MTLIFGQMFLDRRDDSIKQHAILQVYEGGISIMTQKVYHFEWSFTVRGARLIHDQVVRCFVEIGTQIGARSMPGRPLVEQFGKHIPHDVVRPKRVVAEPQSIVIQWGGIEIEDLHERLPVHVLGSFQQRDFRSHCSHQGRKAGPDSKPQPKEANLDNFILKSMYVAYLSTP